MPSWLAQNGQLILFMAQIAYWFFMVLFVGYAVVQYKRWVNFQLGTGSSGKRRKNTDELEEVSIEEFVE
jgi:hypothetical protein